MKKYHDGFWLIVKIVVALLLAKFLFWDVNFMITSPWVRTPTMFVALLASPFVIWYLCYEASFVLFEGREVLS